MHACARIIARLVFAVSMLLVFSACSGSPVEEPVLHVYNWTDYIGETTIADFQAKTGIRVIYDVYDSNEILETKLLTGHTGYDVVVPSAGFLGRQIMAGVFRKLDKRKLPNLSNMDPEIMRLVAIQDPGNQYSVSYLWGTTGLGYNPEKVEDVLGTRTIDSWNAVFDPAVASRLSKCGIAMIDSPSDVFKAARIYLGRSADSEGADDLAAVEALLVKVRPYVRYFNSSQHINDLATGEICIAVGWNGGILQARSRGRTAATPVEIAYSIPREGAAVWFDTLAIPADAPNPDNAHAFLNYLMEPEVIAGVTNDVEYANGNAASLPFVSAALRNDPAVFPPGDVRKSLHPVHVDSQEYSRSLNRAWTRIRTGQ